MTKEAHSATYTSARPSMSASGKPSHGRSVLAPTPSASASVLSAAQIRTLNRDTWIATLEPSLKREIILRGRLRTCPARSLLYSSGSPPSGFFAVLSGEIRLEHVTRSGKFAVYRSMGPGDTFGMLSELDASPRFSDARAVNDTTVMNLTHADCQDLLRNWPGAREAFLAYICANLHKILDLLVEQQSTPPRAQIASILISIFSRGVNDPSAPPKLTQETLAAMAGVSRQTASKVLHEFRDMGLISMNYGKVRALDVQRLQQIATPEHGVPLVRG